MSGHDPWSGQRVVVTGGGSGIGEATVLKAVELGAEVLAVGRDTDSLARVAERAAPRVHTHACDVTAWGAAATITSVACERLGGIDAVVNNAGHARFAPLEHAGPDEFERMLATNVVAASELIRASLPELRSNRGSVVNVSSVGGVLAMPGRAHYGASKAALNSLTRSLATELSPDVRVNAVLPGPVDTKLWEEAASDDVGALRERIIAGTPMGRFGEPGEVATWICHLLDPTGAAWVTGSLIAVDGGRTA
ncbi:SDR family NAD(P)-dependent oxidoreductase [Actinopolyspora sp. H202]|uniref:SDR family NAD(P)-dependent oxidoreductase n=1 Tax=Actinopolyspora sp. H202 TaxID=1500456 RepID=UPI003EE64E55